MRVRRLLLFPLAALAAACNPPAAKLTQLNGAVLVPSGGSNLFNGEFVLTSPAAGACPSLSTRLTATEDGAALTESNPAESPEVPSGPEFCIIAELDASGAPDAGEAVTTYDLSDGTNTIHAEYPALHAPRQLALSSQGPWAPGDTITMGWLPATDTLVPAGDPTFPTALAWFTVPSGSGSTNVGTEMRSGNGTLIVTVPPSIAPGTVTMNILMPATVAAGVCTGPVTCGTYGDTYNFQVPVTIVAP